MSRYVDQVLTQIAKGFRPDGHINELLLPGMPVKKQSGKIAVYGADNLRLMTTIKSAEGETPVVSTRPTLADAYNLEEHALKALASDKEAENQDDPIDEQRDKTELVTDILSVGREIALASFMSSTSNITQNVTLSSNDQWNVDHADSTPIGDVDTAVQTVADAMGVDDEQITLVMGLAVFRRLVRHETILDTLGFKYNQAVQMTKQQLAAAFGVKNIIVAGGIYNSAAEGQTDVISRIWGKNLWAMYIAPTPKLKQRTFGYTMKRKAGPVVDKWYDNDRKGWWVRNTDEFDQYIMYANAAYLIKDAVA